MVGGVERDVERPRHLVEDLDLLPLQLHHLGRSRERLPDGHGLGADPGDGGVELQQQAGRLVRPDAIVRAADPDRVDRKEAKAEIG